MKALKITKGLLTAVLVTSAFLLGTSSHAQEVYPNRPIRIIVPLAPGGATDTIARVIARYLSNSLATPVVVENRTGAGGIIGLEAAAKAPNNGYTLFIGNISTNALNETIYADKLKLKPSDSLVPVTMLATIPHILVSSSKFDVRSVKDLTLAAKASPGKINHASPGVGSYSMLDMLTFERAAGLQMVHVPYVGGAGQYVAPLVANEVQIAFLNASSVIAMIEAGKLRALAVTTTERLPELPDVPTMAEVGFPGIGTNAWQGMFVPKGTPQPVIDKIFAAVTEVLRRDDVKQTFEKQLIVPAASKSPMEFDKFVRAEVSHWAKVVSTFNVKVD